MPINEWSGELLAENPVAVAEVMLSRVREALEACATSVEINESYVVLGDLVWDDCCGILAAAPLRTFSSRQFPTPAQDVTNCTSSQLCVELVVILLHCAPQMDDQGNPPSVADMVASSTATANDAAVVYNTLAVADLPEGWERANVEQTFQAEGGCVAVDTRITIGLPQMDWCACPAVE